MNVCDLNIDQNVVIVNPRFGKLNGTQGFVVGIDATDPETFADITIQTEDGTQYTVTEDYVEPVATLPPARRPLSSLSDEEARECYRLAMGHDAKTWAIIAGNAVTVTDGNVKSLHIYSDGIICGEYVSGRPVGVFAAPLVRYLDGLGIQLG